MLKPEAAYERGAPTMDDTTLGWRFVNPRMPAAYPPISLGETAENVADEYACRRERQDAFALESQRRAAAAIADGRFDAELVPVEVPGRKGAATVVDRDEHPRPDTTRRRSRAQAGVPEGGTVTAGNSSGINDGASARSWSSRGGARAWPAPARARRVDRGRRRRPGRDGHRAGAGDRKALREPG